MSNQILNNTITHTQTNNNEKRTPSTFSIWFDFVTRRKTSFLSALRVAADWESVSTRVPDCWAVRVWQSGKNRPTEAENAWAIWTRIAALSGAQSESPVGRVVDLLCRPLGKNEKSRPVVGRVEEPGKRREREQWLLSFSKLFIDQNYAKILDGLGGTLIEKQLSIVVSASAPSDASNMRVKVINDFDMHMRAQRCHIEGEGDDEQFIGL